MTAAGAGDDQGTGDPAADAKATPDGGTLPLGRSAGMSLGGHVTLLQELGSGSSGTVFRARLEEPYAGLPAGAEVAIKFLRQDRLQDARERERIVAEGQLGQRIRHANVAAILGVETLTVLGLSSTYLVMELVRGTTLRSFLADQGPPIEDLTRRIGADAALGLSALHRRGIAHRDIKPENLVLTEAGMIKIVDLGLARAIGQRGPTAGSAGAGSASGSGSGSASGSASGSSSGSGSAGGSKRTKGRSGVVGSVAYAAPETLLGKRASPQSDLYALGVVLYEVAAGRHPFHDCATADEMLHAHLHQEPPRPSHLRPRISPLLERLLLALLHKDPLARPADAALVARILQQGEASDWWRECEQEAPRLGSISRLQRMRRPAETAFFGRREELALLQRSLGAALRGRGKARCIRGPQGIGRRRLLDEAMASWLQRHDDLLILGGQADPGLGHAEPFASALLDLLLRGDSPTSPQAPLRAEAEARVLLDLDERDAQALVAVAMGQSQEEPEVRANRLANALLSLPHKDRTLALRVDMADRLDTSGRLVLQRLLRELKNRRLLLLLTAGPDWQPPDGLATVDLHGLDERDFLDFGAALFLDGEAPMPKLTAAHATFSGSPGNLIEALEHLVQRGELLGRPGSCHGLGAAVELRPAPRHLQRFEQRVAAMPAEQRRALAAAAVLGNRAAIADIAALADSTELLALEALSRFRGRVLRAQRGAVEFRHRDFQQALLAQLDAVERARLHAQAAQLLEQRGRPPLEVGMHRSQAMDHEGCVEPLLLGLADLVRSGSRRTSLRVASRLSVHLQRWPGGPEQQAAELRLCLLWAKARANNSQSELAAELYQRADALARGLLDPLGRGEALTGLAGATFQRGLLMQAILLLENAHTALEDAASERGLALAADAHGLHGRILLYLGESDSGLRHVQAALRLLPDDEAERRLHLLIDLARLEALRHHYPTAQKTLARADDRRARHLPRVQLRLRLYRGQFRSVLGDDEGAVDLRACVAQAERLGLFAYGARARIFLGERAFQQGKDDDATAEWLDAKALAEAGDDALGRTLARIHLARLGGPEDGLEAEVEAMGLPSLQTALLLQQAARARQHGLPEAVKPLADQALALCAAADIPLHLHLRALALAGHDASARSLVSAIAGRLRDRRAQRRFLAAWQDGARI